MKSERRSIEARRRDVRAVLAAGQMIVAGDERATIAATLSRELPLSILSILRAFDVCVEKDATDAQLDAVFAWAGDEVDEVAVILSAGVFTAAVRAVALGFAVGRSVVVRPSRRDRRFPKILVAALDDPRVRLVDELDVQSYKGDELHVYGSDATLADVRGQAGPGLRVRGHGHGFGLALVTRASASASDIASAAGALADDVVLFDQRGCLSPRVAFVVGEANAAAFASALHSALEERERVLPRGQMSAEERAEARRYAESIAFAGELHRGAAHLVGAATGPLVLPPPGRHVHVVAVPDIAAARNIVTPFARYITSVGTEDPEAARALELPHARVASLGQMQRPPFDGPVDRRPA